MFLARVGESPGERPLSSLEPTATYSMGYSLEMRRASHAVALRLKRHGKSNRETVNIARFALQLVAGKSTSPRGADMALLAMSRNRRRWDVAPTASPPPYIFFNISELKLSTISGGSGSWALARSKYPGRATRTSGPPAYRRIRLWSWTSYVPWPLSGERG